MVTAVWKDTTIASSGETVVVEGYHYFPPSAVDLRLLEMSPHTSVCPIKGLARYFHVRVGDALNPNAAWTYNDPNPCRGGYPGSYRLLERRGGRLISLPGSTGDPMTPSQRPFCAYREKRSWPTASPAPRHTTEHLAQRYRNYSLSPLDFVW